ncbi:hypothetical protein SAMN04487886_107012 [Clostridium sp. DSM 8431]|uniref:CPBP family intramembrane glutamic endopeptidase n=1 Tax=Clostridium sp. DSM 8431 TaxID=1761781 RepID=UPI0008E35893|nr:type II CAAX endopeptidase family protein [Clostridium sp. DSM 8431]SFU59874.1 hypothetical protein SAMN04487886_107012 [Clostridium sp. DSM 8431]
MSVRERIDILLRVIFTVLIYIIIQTGVQIVSVFIAYFQNVSVDVNLTESIISSVVKMKESKYLISFISIIFTSIVYYFKFFLKKNSEEAIDIKLKKISICQFIESIFIGISITCLLYIFMTNCLINEESVNPHLVLTNFSMLNIIFYVFIGGILVPIFEEILYRGIVFEHLKKLFNIKLVIVLQAVIFAITHNNKAQVIYTLILGLILGVVYCINENIINCCIIHIIFNVLGMYVLPYVNWTNKTMYGIIGASIVVLFIGVLCMVKKKDYVDVLK